MAIASLFGFETILLMGIDLCWSTEGESHMKDVSYLSEEGYKKFNSTLWKDSISLKNMEGKEVRTNRYWMLFKQQFEGWADLMKVKLHSKIYNLSPTGLSLLNTTSLSLDDAEKLLNPNDVQALREISFRTSIPEFRREDLIHRLAEWHKKNESFQKRISNWISDSRTSSAVLAEMKVDEQYPTVLGSILGPVFDLEARMPGAIDSADLRVSLKQISEALDVGKASADRVQKNLFSTHYFVA